MQNQYFYRENVLPTEIIKNYYSVRGIKKYKKQAKIDFGFRKIITNQLHKEY